MRGVQQFGDGVQVVGVKGLRGGVDARVLADDVARAAQQRAVEGAQVGGLFFGSMSKCNTSSRTPSFV